MRRRRKQRLTWFPTLGTQQDAVIGTFGDNPSGRAFSLLGIATTGPAVTAETELTFDEPSDTQVEFLGLVNPSLLNTMGLSAWEMNSWRLRRIVGKMFAGCTINDNQEPTPAPAALFTAGIIVRSVDDETGTPEIGGAAANPANLRNIRDPWIWRRQWILSSAFSGQGTSGVVDAFLSFPRTTADYGSVMDGPHLDQKCNRVIGPQERLILNVSAVALPIPHNSAPTGNNIEVHGYFDYRLLGSLMRSTNRRNASR